MTLLNLVSNVNSLFRNVIFVGMIGQRKIISLISGLVILLIFPLWLGAQTQIDANKIQLANRYFQDQEFEKAAVLFKEIFELSKSEYYFEYYLNCLAELNDFELAEKEIKRQLRKSNNTKLYVHWGYLLKLQNQILEAEGKYEKSINTILLTKTGISSLANTFISRREFEWAEKTYLHGRKKLPEEDFTYELARVYLYQRNFELMIAEYLYMLKTDENKLSRVQNGIRSAFRSDLDDSLPKLFQTAILKQIQADPSILAYNRLLIWLFIQKTEFKQAYNQLVALDKRTGNEENALMMLAQSAGNNQVWELAVQSYNYLLEKELSADLVMKVHLGKMNMLYQQFKEKSTGSLSANLLKVEFDACLEAVGYKAESASMIINYAHFLAFYFDKPKEAIKLLEVGEQIKRLPGLQRALMKNEKADIYVYEDDPWEAVLLYSQLIEVNKNNSLGDDVKLKKARLAYYLGDLAWAQAQLDIIKASTSKLVANDAMELSLFISNNSSLDTTEVPLQLFAKADLLSYKMHIEEAWSVLDSIEQFYNTHSILDDVYFRKAKLKIKEGNYELSMSYLQKILDDYSFDLLADNALFLMAQLHEKHMGNLDRAAELYKQVLTEYPGSIFVIAARERYRKLRGDDIN